MGRLLAVCAHPDDESFGLGAVLAGFAHAGTHCAVLCFTHGEASTLGTAGSDLAPVRAAELAAAATCLRVERAELLAYPDSRLATVPLGELAAHVRRLIAELGAEALLVFDEGGITGHPDHGQATAAASRAAAGPPPLPVLAWAVPAAVAAILDAEFGTRFVGRRPDELDLEVAVDRTDQLRAIACHRSQSADNPVLWRRLALQGGREWLRFLTRAGAGRGSRAAGS